MKLNKIKGAISKYVYCKISIKDTLIKKPDNILPGF